MVGYAQAGPSTRSFFNSQDRLLHFRIMNAVLFVSNQLC